MDPPALPTASATENTCDHPLPPVPSARLRLMCSFGGHILPRPHDKSLCYIGGETRLVAVDRHCCLSAFCNRLSRALLNGRPFTLKYQLPNEDLDSLVSVATDEDLENMVEEYDRLTATSTSSVTSSRIRLFLFFNKPDTVASMGPLLSDAKSETWFVDALNSSGLIPRGDSDSATMDTLFKLDGEFEKQQGAEEQNKQAGNDNTAAPEMQYPLPDSPSMSNFPSIRVRVDQDQKVGIEDQISFATNIHKQDDGNGAPHPLSIATAKVTPAGGSSEGLTQILSDDGRSDQGVPVGFRKPPLPLHPHPLQHKACGTYNLPSPDSVASDSSIASANSLSKPIYYQDQRAASSPSTNADACIRSSQVQIQQAPDSCALAPQLDQQQQQSHRQFMQSNMHYIHHTTATPAPVPISSYHSVYAPPAQLQLHHPTDQQYPAVYVMPVTHVTQPKPYMSMQSNVTDASIMAPPIVAASTAYKEAMPPIYPTNAATLAKPQPETTASVYTTAVASTHQVVQVQQPYVGFSQMQPPPQSAAVNHTATTNYIYEYPNPTQDQTYYAPLPAQYQTMTQAAAAAALADTSKQLPTDSSNQQNRISQPL
ncbi:hypothetical protein PTKIN_Ptkin05aG0133200 [Pterospermum kingtungense]